MVGERWEGMAAGGRGSIGPAAGGSAGGERAMAEDLQQVVRQAHQIPFALHRLQSAEQKLSEAAAVFDLAEGGFRDRFAVGLFGAACLGPQLAGHFLFRRQIFRRAAVRSGGGLLVMLQAAGGDVHFLDPRVRFQRSCVVFAEVTGIGGERTDVFCHADRIQILDRLRHHRGDLTHVVGLIRDIGRDDDLIFIDDRLRVATLIEALVRRLHNLRFGIGEVPLILGLGNRRARIVARRATFRGQLCRVVGGLLATLRFQGGFGFANLLQASFPTRQFRGQFVAANVAAVLFVFRLVGGLSFRQQVVDLLLQTHFLGGQAVVAQGLVTRCSCRRSMMRRAVNDLKRPNCSGKSSAEASLGRWFSRIN